MKEPALEDARPRLQPLDDVDELLAELALRGNVVTSADGRGHRADCPASDHRTALSLAVRAAPGDYVPALVHCHAGCTMRDVYEALGFEYRPRTTAPAAGGGREHRYFDVHGRYVGSAFKLADGSWRRSPAGVAFPLFNLPAVAEAIAGGDEIWLCEGEKDAETASLLEGVTGTSAPSHRLTDAHVASLSGARVRIVTDNDWRAPRPAGLMHAAAWSERLERGGVEVTGVHVPRGRKDLAELLDAIVVGIFAAADAGDPEPAEWIASGRPLPLREAVEAALADVDAEEARVAISTDDPSSGRYELQERARLRARHQAEDERRATAAAADGKRLLEGTLSVSDLLAMPDSRYVLDGVLPEGSVALLAGTPGSLKSFVTLDWACHIASGTDWHGRRVAPGDVFYIAAEGGGGYGQRMRAWAAAHRPAAPNRLRLYPDRLDIGAAGADASLLRWIGSASDPRLLVVDTLRKVSGGLDENSTAIGQVLDNLDRLRKVHSGLAVVVVHHLNKAGGIRGSSALEGDADAVIVATRSGGALATRLKVEKQKDGRDGLALDVRLDAHEGSLAVVGVTDAPQNENSLTALELHALATIRRAAGPVAQAALARTTGRDKADISRAIQALSARGLIHRADRPAGAAPNSNWWVAGEGDSE